MISDALSFFPDAFRRGMRKLRSMKRFKEIVLMFAVVAGLALGVPAQNNDDQKRPPKKPPVREPKEKPPKGNDRPKKPGMSYYLVSRETENKLA
jgi:hypothetical protein